VIGRQRIVCVASRHDEPVLMDDGVLAGPLMDAETGDVLGMLKIEKLGFFDLHFSNVETFRVLCDWIGQAYVNARTAEQERSDSFFNPSVRLFSYVFFERLIEYLTHLARRIGFNLTLLLLRVDNSRDLTEERRKELPALVNATMLEVLRSTDLAFDYRRGGHHFCILLPKMSDVHVHRVADRIVSYLATLAPEVRFSYIVQVIEQGDAASTSHEELARAAS
jgi:GGDEF domain-containing protein